MSLFPPNLKSLQFLELRLWIWSLLQRPFHWLYQGHDYLDVLRCQAPKQFQ